MYLCPRLQNSTGWLRFKSNTFPGCNLNGATEYFLFLQGLEFSIAGPFNPNLDIYFLYQRWKYKTDIMEDTLKPCYSFQLYPKQQSHLSIPPVSHHLCQSNSLLILSWEIDGQWAGGDRTCGLRNLQALCSVSMRTGQCPGDAPSPQGFRSGSHPQEPYLRKSLALLPPKAGSLLSTICALVEGSQELQTKLQLPCSGILVLLHTHVFSH